MEAEDAGVEGYRLLLDVVVGQGLAAFQLPDSEGQALLVWIPHESWDALFVLGYPPRPRMPSSS